MLTKQKAHIEVLYTCSCRQHLSLILVTAETNNKSSTSESINVATQQTQQYKTNCEHMYTEFSSSITLGLDKVDWLISLAGIRKVRPQTSFYRAMLC